MQRLALLVGVKDAVLLSMSGGRVIVQSWHDGPGELLRGFSAPVNLTIEQNETDLAFLMANDSDEFNRWQATQDYGVRLLIGGVTALRKETSAPDARPFITSLELIVADEPVSMLDVSLRAGILRLLARLRTDHGLSLLYITHDLLSARVVTDEILVLNEGKVVERGATKAVLQHPTATTCFVCGPNALVTETVETLKALGVPDGLVRIEQWGR